MDTMDLAMTAIRLIPLPLHGAFQMATGLATMVAPFVMGFDPAATLIAVVVGAVLVGVALASVTDERGQIAVHVSTLHAADYGLAFGLFGAAAIVALDGDDVAGITFAVLATMQLALNLTTRYSLRG
jgi:hypothetical protein